MVWGKKNILSLMLCNVRVNRKAPGTVRKSDVSTLLTGVGERNPQLNASIGITGVSVRGNFYRMMNYQGFVDLILLGRDKKMSLRFFPSILSKDLIARIKNKFRYLSLLLYDYLSKNLFEGRKTTVGIFL